MTIIQKHREFYGNITKMIPMIRSKSFKFKIKIMGETSAAGNTKDVEIMVPLKYLSDA